MPAALTCSVVIPTYNAVDTIGRQLSALASQEDADPFEIIVADNGSTDGLARLIEEWSTRLPWLRHIDASAQRGVSAARNAGIEVARTDRLLICDADDEVSSRWVAAMCHGLAVHPLVSGPVETERLSGRSAAWVPIPARTSSLFETWGGRTYGIGCNLGLRREVWKAVGGFDPSFPAGGEEIDFAWRARDLGFEFGYVEGALLHYRIRADLRGVLRQQYNSGRGVTTLYARHRPQEVRIRSWRRQLHHEYLVLRQFPWRGGADAWRGGAATIAFEAGKVREAVRLRVPSP